MLRILIFLTLSLCPTAFCEFPHQNGSADAGKPAAPSDLSISCQVDPNSRLVTVTLTNRTPKRVYFQYQNNIDARDNYRVVVSDRNDKPLPVPTPRNDPDGSKGIRVIRESAAGLLVLDPQVRRAEEFPLSAFALLPQLGKVRIKVGRGLFAEWSNPFRLDPSRVVWCKPIEVDFPTTK